MITMKPVTVTQLPPPESDDPLLKTIKTEFPVDPISKDAKKSLLDRIRNVYISETSSYLFAKDTDEVVLNQCGKVSYERQAFIEDIVNKYAILTDEERLFFFLRLPLQDYRSRAVHP